jgi:Essential protein Yae1, N terminal
MGDGAVSPEDAAGTIEGDPFDTVAGLEEWYAPQCGGHSDQKRYFKQGYDEGLVEGLKSSPDEGFEIGHKLAFQRFLELGILLGRCAIWRYALSHDSRHRIVLSALTEYRTLKYITMIEGRLRHLQLQIESETEHVEYEEIRDDVMRRVRLVEAGLKEKRIQGREKGIENSDPVALAKQMDRELQL